MAIKYFLSHDADGTINDTIAFLLLKWFLGLLYDFCANVSIGAGISVRFPW